MNTNEFFDINKLPPEKGLLVFPISMSRILNSQNPEACLEYVRSISPNKVSKPLIGLNIIYGDFLYLYSDKPAPELKHTFMNQVIDHSNGMRKLFEKNNIEFQIQHAINYMVWNQLYVGTRDFNHKFAVIKKLYETDSLLQKYILQDCEFFGRSIGEHQVHFFLEEHLMFYLIAKGQVKLPNEYIQDSQKWILICYPGRPPKAHIYLMQQNPFQLDWPENKYQNVALYDLSRHELIDCTRVDLDTYTLE